MPICCLGRALAGVMGLKESPANIEQLVDLAVYVQTSPTCVTAVKFEPEFTVGGYAMPGQLHLAAAAVNIFKCRQACQKFCEASGVDGGESAFELHANGGLVACPATSLAPELQ